MPKLRRFSFAPRRSQLWGALLVSIAAAPAFGAPLVPMTRLRLSVVQFVPTSGEYRRWDALGGEFDVAVDGTITVPALGTIKVGDLTTDQLATEIATRLQTKLGLLDMPDASIQVLQYPPIYVVGSVSTPGQFEYRPQMTVVQALALAGGVLRADAKAGLSDTIKLETDLQGFGSDIVRATARLARLDAEYNLAKEIVFPVVLDPADPVTAGIIDQERRIFDAHGNEILRQQTGLQQLAELYNAEIEALGQKLAAIDQQIAAAQKQITVIRTLVTSGSATVSRLTDAERVLSDLQSERLDNVIETMRGRENLNQSQRDLAKLQDEQQSETANQLQESQAGLEKLGQLQLATRRILYQSMDQLNVLPIQVSLDYQILRQAGDTQVSIFATETSVLQPGDLVKVQMVTQPVGDQPTAAADLASATIQP